MSVTADMSPRNGAAPNGITRPDVGEDPVAVVRRRRRHADDALAGAQPTVCVAEVRRVTEAEHRADVRHDPVTVARAGGLDVDDVADVRSALVRDVTEREHRTVDADHPVAALHDGCDRASMRSRLLGAGTPSHRSTRPLAVCGRPRGAGIVIVAMPGPETVTGLPTGEPSTGELTVPVGIRTDERTRHGRLAARAAHRRSAFLGVIVRPVVLGTLTTVCDSTSVLGLKFVVPRNVGLDQVGARREAGADERRVARRERDRTADGCTVDRQLHRARRRARARR